MWKHPGTDFFAHLKQHQVPFVIVGGHAVNLYAAPRSTEDIDLVWMRSAESTPRLLRALQEANAQWISNEKDPATKIEKLVPVTAAYVNVEHIMMLVTDYGFVDLFDFIPGLPGEAPQVFFDESITVDGLQYASIDWVKKMKQVAGRPKDLQDLENLP